MGSNFLPSHLRAPLNSPNPRPHKYPDIDRVSKVHPPRHLQTLIPLSRRIKEYTLDMKVGKHLILGNLQYEQPIAPPIRTDERRVTASDNHLSYTQPPNQSMPNNNNQKTGRRRA